MDIFLTFASHPSGRLKRLVFCNNIKETVGVSCSHTVRCLSWPAAARASCIFFSSSTLRRSAARSRSLNPFIRLSYPSSPAASWQSHPDLPGRSRPIPSRDQAPLQLDRLLLPNRRQRRSVRLIRRARGDPGKRAIASSCELGQTMVLLAHGLQALRRDVADVTVAVSLSRKGRDGRPARIALERHAQA